MEFIRWKDHSFDLLSSITELYQNDQLIDCELDTNGGFLKGHTAILAACSPYLKRLLVDQKGIKTIPLKQVYFKDMKHILNFIYYGEVGVSKNDVASLMKAAEFLQITSLTHLSSKVGDLLCEGSCEPNMKNKEMLLNNPNVTFDGSNDCDGRRAEDLKIELESICDVFEHDIKPEKLFGSVVISQTSDVEDLVNIEKDEQMADSLRISQVKEQDNQAQRMSSQGVNPSQQMIIDSENLASEGKMYSFEKTTVSSVKHEEIKDAENSYKDVKLDLFSTVCISDDSLDAEMENSCSDSMEGNESVDLCIQMKPHDDRTTDHEGNSSCSASAAITEEKLLSKIGNSHKNIYLCELCGLNFKTSKLLNIHLRVHEGEKVVQEKKKSACEKTYLCHLCPEVYYNASNLRLHIRKHQGEKPFTCDFCQSSFESQEKLKEHLYQHTKDYPHIYSECGSGFTKKSKLMVHQKTHSNEKPFSCTLCPKSFKYKASCEAHILRHSAKVLPKKINNFSCDFCQSSFDAREKLKVHLYQHTKDYPHICSECGSGFTKKSKLMVHEKTHSNEKPFSCTLCPKSFKHKASCEAHILTHSEKVLPEKSNNFSCDSCTYSCRYLSQLKIHQRKHTGEKPYLCHYCEASFTSSGSLQYHVRIHTGEKPYSCDKCDASFSQKGGLLRHEKTHTGEKGKQVCEVCGAMFRDKYDLREHFISHTGEQRYSCHICHVKLRHKTTLRNHMRIHTGDTRYSCKFCGVFFIHSGSLHNHLRIHK